ncbi:hypothetical protein [Komagataeibacter diospyri]|uniref:Aminoglycoside phosphotransferase domain-containing protein n=1 Tax=Komagataeibacter diospyri TaxID=1932662 RepID=A0A4P5NS51_9PROT|nr:hypothetical protein [Komagataeibacter diospyri]GCE82631.1 hypothetical protein MSKU9_0772 [Komagataeibacter diospyri]
MNDSASAQALQAFRAKDVTRTCTILSDLIREEFGLRVSNITLGNDGYSLNSVNGFLTIPTGEEYFFKFHHEENEEITLQEFYRGEVLRDAGYPIDMPVYVSRAVGRQILLYTKRSTPRLADLCRTYDATDADIRPVVAAQRELDALTARIYRETFHPISEAECATEPFHQLFHHRLTTDDRQLGARAARFFASGRTFAFPGVSVADHALLDMKWRINGVMYADTLRTVLERSMRLLSPRMLARFGGVTAHGDAHNANVWWEGTGRSLTFFDPAFAGQDIPAIMAEVKATFHNIFAHADWLYHPHDLPADMVTHASMTPDGILDVTSGWEMNDLRRAFLDSKAVLLWRPLLKHMRAMGQLPADWRATIRCGLFCCPTLVMDLCADGAGGHTPLSSLTGLAVAVMCGSESVPPRQDVVSRFLDAIDPGN